MAPRCSVYETKVLVNRLTGPTRLLTCSPKTRHMPALSVEDNAAPPHVSTTPPLSLTAAPTTTTPVGGGGGGPK
ncbi:hypothetical protein Pmani_017457 [Petrolisthes manimaculis]|uniref:Uncharacterized protein n=1 Tax=Petrolisthes manimaculis TaxID=1843537 RepID=A0AAE1PMZ8_9EUCA|nr:hypothetical protein Pmani_017457 [Petrolisthes manimaculis]